jgi:hypothetical protein
MFTKFEIFRVGFASLTAFPAPNPKLCSSCPTLVAENFFSAPSFFFSSYFFFCLGRVLFATSLTAAL